MLRKVFIFLSTLVVSLFILLQIDQRREVLLFTRYDAIDILSRTEGETRVETDTFYEHLDQFAREQNFLLARRIIEPTKNGQQHFSYALYGEGELPEGYHQASTESERTSDPESSYLILKGTEKREALLDFIVSQGFRVAWAEKYHLLDDVRMILLSDFLLFVILIFFLIYMTISLLRTINELKKYSVMLLNGYSLKRLVLLHLKDDFRILLIIGLINTALVFPYLMVVNHLSIFFMILYLASFWIYLTGLLILSLFIAFLLYICLKGELLSFVKGHLPFKRLAFMLLLGQALSLSLAGWVLADLQFYQKQYETVQRSQKDWEKLSDYFKPTYGMSAALANKEDTDILEGEWYDYLNKVFRDDQALMVVNNLSRYPQNRATFEGNPSDYNFWGNSLVVSPNYLELADIKVSDDFKHKIASMKRGEFGLLLPKKLIEKRTSILHDYQKELSEFSRTGLTEDAPLTYQAHIYDEVIPDNKEMVAYNLSENNLVQYLQDPIIVITTPESIGDTTVGRLYLSVAVSNGIFLKGYDSTVRALKQEGLYSSISYLSNAQRQYEKILSKTRNQLLVRWSNVLMEIVIVILFFYVVVSLYFEQYRKELLLKRIFGLSFLLRHSFFLYLQCVTLITSFVAIVLLVRSLEIAGIIVFTALLGNMIVFFVKEKTTYVRSIEIVKGK